MKNNKLKNMNDCSCQECQSACNYRPGWFFPGEAEKAADLLGISFQELFSTRLSIDWWASDEDIFILSPATHNSDPGEEMPDDPRGICTFFKDGKCEIHDAKPFECRQLSHDDSNNDIAERHQSVAGEWEKHQHQIEKLLGRKPTACKSKSLFDMFLF